MKKLLSILASLSIAASSSVGVVACSDVHTTNQKSDSLVNNNLQDILGASLEKAKSVIINNEYGISQSKTNQILGARTLDQDGLDGSKDDGFSGNTKVEKLISKYYGSSDVTNNTTENNISLGGTNGTQSGLNYIVGSLLDKTINNSFIKNFILRNMNSAIDWLGMTTSAVNTAVVEQTNQDAFNLGIGDKWLPNMALATGINYLNKNNTTGWVKVVIKIINGILSGGSTVNTTLTSIFGSSAVNVVRNVVKDAFADGDNQFNKVVFENTDFKLPDFKDGTKPDVIYSPKGQTAIPVTEISSIGIKDIKKEIAASADRILTALFDFTDDSSNTSSSNEKPVTDIANDLSTKLGVLIGKLMSGQKPKMNPLDQKTIMGMTVEGTRLLVILNSAFSMFENIQDTGTIQSSKNLFGNMTNYEYLNTRTVDGKNVTDPDDIAKEKDFLWNTQKTLKDTEYLNRFDGTKDPININYLISNLNYYLGDLDNKDGQGAYRVQQLLFLLFNDPSSELNPADGSQVPSISDNMTYKNSSIIDFVLNLGLEVGYTYASKQTSDTWKTVTNILGQIKDDPATLGTFEDMLIKPVILGLINGKSFKNVYDLLVNGLQAVITQIPAVKKLVKVFQNVVDEIMNSLKRLVQNPEFTNDTIHSLFTIDMRPILKGISIIPEDILDKFFGPTAPINLTTLLSMPLNKVLTLAGVPGFEGGKVSPIGDYYTTQTIPQLIGTLNELFNNFDTNGNQLATKYIAYKDKDHKEVDWVHSIKSRDLDLNALYGLVTSIIGSDPKGSDNIFSQLLSVVKVTPLTPDETKKAADPSLPTVPNVTINPAQFLQVIGANAPGQTPSNNTKLDKTDDGGDKPKPVIAITYTHQKFTWSLYKLVLPLIDHTVDKPDDDIKMDQKYLSFDLLNDAYTKAIGVLRDLNTPGDYLMMLNQILSYKDAFIFSYDSKDIGYFPDYRKLVKSLKFKIQFHNYVSGRTNSYTFYVSRDSNIMGFQINKITSDKDD